MIIVFGLASLRLVPATGDRRGFLPRLPEKEDGRPEGRPSSMWMNVRGRLRPGMPSNWQQSSSEH
jgi:hypothetical protein